MKNIFYTLLIILAGFTSCTYDYNMPDMWVMPKYQIITEIDGIQLLEEYGYEIASVETIITFYNSSDEIVDEFNYKSSQDKLLIPREVVYFIVRKEYYGWAADSYNHKKEKVCIITTEPIRVNHDLHPMDRDTIIKETITLNTVDKIEYCVEQSYCLYISHKLPLRNWAEDYGYEMFGADTFVSVYNSDGSVAQYRHNYSSLDPIVCTKGQLLLYEVEVSYRYSYGNIKPLYTVVFDKIPAENIGKERPTKDEPYIITTANSYKLQYFVSKQ